MILENSIGWCDVTGNKVIGCDKVSPGCKNCYAANDTPARVLRSRGIETWGPKGTRVPVAGFSQKVRQLNRRCICDRCHLTHSFDLLAGVTFCRCGGPLRRIRLFANSNSDWLDERWPTDVLADFLKDIHDNPNVDFLLLTKRPENFAGVSHIHSILRDLYGAGEGASGGYTQSGLKFYSWLAGWVSGERPPANVWLGVSVENQWQANGRLPQLFDIPAAVHFASLEPLLGDVNIAPFLLSDYDKRCYDTQLIVSLDTRHDNKLDWVIVGGESGRDARPCNVKWVREIVADTHTYGCPVYVKQLGTFSIHERGSQRIRTCWDHPKGGDLHEWPADLQRRDFPLIAPR